MNRQKKNQAREEKQLCVREEYVDCERNVCQKVKIGKTFLPCYG